MNFLRLIIALLTTRKSRWHKTDIPVTPGVFSHDPYCRYTLECLDGFYGVRVIDLIAVLMKCDLYDVVTVNNDTTGIKSVELFGGIPLMDICDGVTIVTENTERVNRDDARRVDRKAEPGVGHEMKLFSESIDAKARQLLYEGPTFVGAILILVGTVGGIILAAQAHDLAGIVLILSAVIGAALVNIMAALVCARLAIHAMAEYKELKNGPVHDIVNGHE